MSESVLVRVAHSGKLHRATLSDTGKLLTFEGCNLDDAIDPEVLKPEDAAEAIQNAEPGTLCENDFPDVPA